MTYTRKKSYDAYCPALLNATWLNESVEGDGTPIALTAVTLVPPNPTDQDLPVLEPQLNEEEKKSIGDGLTVGEIYDLGWKDGAGMKHGVCIFGHHIKDSFGALDATEITGVVAEISTVACIASDGSNLSGKYFEFDVVDADGNKPLIKYYCWIDINNGSADPAVTGRTAVEVDIGAGAQTDSVVCAAVVAAIDALDDCGAAQGAGESDHICTITNATVGAVDDCHDVDSGFTCEVTTDGVTTKVIDEDDTLPNIGYHTERELSSEDIRVDYVGLAQLEYIFRCESGGKLEEERNYIVAQDIDGSDLARPRGADGLAWTSTQHCHPRYKKNFSWGDMTFTFKYNSVAVESEIHGFNIKVINDVEYKRVDGDDHSNKHYLKGRTYEITLKVRPTGTDLRDIGRTKWNAYAGDLTLVIKAQRGDDTNDYINWDFTKLRLLPFEQMIKGEGYYEEYDIILHGAPGNATTVTVKGYLSQQYFGVA